METYPAALVSHKPISEKTQNAVELRRGDYGNEAGKESSNYLSGNRQSRLVMIRVFYFLKHFLVLVDNRASISCTGQKQMRQSEGLIIGTIKILWQLKTSSRLHERPITLTNLIRRVRNSPISNRLMVNFKTLLLTSRNIRIQIHIRRILAINFSEILSYLARYLCNLSSYHRFFIQETHWPSEHFVEKLNSWVNLVLWKTC